MSQLILTALRDPAVRDKIQIDLQSDGFHVHSAPDLDRLLIGAPVAVAPVLVLLDDPGDDDGLTDSLRRLADVHPRVAVALVGGREESTRRALKYGIFATLAPSPSPGEIAHLARHAETLRRALHSESLLDRENQQALGESPIFGASAAMIRFLEELERVATLDTPVLISGEPGTGKEVIARALHAQSHRRNAPFTRIAASLQSVEQVEAQLFGRHRHPLRASPTPGLVEETRAGTLFVDGLFSLPRSLQEPLAAVLRPRTDDPSAGIRLVASNDRPIDSDAREEAMDAALFSLLLETQIDLPPLRKRTEDIPLLATHFIARACARLGHPPLPLRDDALERLIRYSWPGNVRELENVMEVACCRLPVEAIDSERLRELLPEPLPEEALSLRHARRVAERAAIQRALVATGGNRTHAARRLSISSRSLLYKIKEFGLRD